MTVARGMGREPVEDAGLPVLPPPFRPSLSVGLLREFALVRASSSTQRCSGLHVKGKGGRVHQAR